MTSESKNNDFRLENSSSKAAEHRRTPKRKRVTTRGLLFALMEQFP